MFDQIRNKKTLAVTYGAMAIEGGLNTFFVALMVLLAAHFGVGREEIGLFLQVKGVGTLIMLYVAGMLSDRYGRKNVILAGAIGFVVFLVGFGLSPTMQIGLIFAFLAGIAHGMTDSPAISIIFDVIDGNTGPAVSIVQAFFASGAMLTSFVASILISTGIAWQWMIVGYLVVIAVLIFGVMKATYPPTQGSEIGDEDERIVFVRKPTFLQDGLLLGITSLVFAFVQGIMMTWIPTFGNLAKGFAEDVATRMLSSYQLGSVVGSIAFAFLLVKYHSTIFMYLNPIVTLVALALTFFVDSALFLNVLYFVCGIGQGIYFSLLVNTGGELFWDRAGSATGAIGTVNMLGNIMAVGVTSQLLNVAGVAAIFEIAVVLLVALIVLAWLFRRHYLSLDPKKMTQREFLEYIRNKEAVYERTPF